MTDSANVIHLKLDVQRHVRGRLARMAAPVRAFHDAGQKVLTERLIAYFDLADDALFEMADKAATNAEQNACFDAMRELRQQRKHFQAGFFDVLDELFARLVGEDHRDNVSHDASLTADALSLVGSSDLEQMVALEATVGLIDAQFGEQTRCLAYLLGLEFKTDLPLEYYPFSAFCLSHAAMAQIKGLAIELKSKLLLFKLFEQTVLLQFGMLNSALFASFKAHGIDTHVPTSVTAPIPLASEKAKFDSSKRELLDLLSFIQKLPVVSSSPIMDIERVLNTVQERRGVKLDLSVLERETIKLVEMLFRLIVRKQTMAAPMQELIYRLQVPVLKVALLDPGFLSERAHPARQLLNELAAVAVQWLPTTGDLHEEYAYQLVRSTIDRVVSGFDLNLDVFKSVLADFSSVVEKEKRLANVQEKRTVDAEDGKAMAAQARQRVAAEISLKTNGQDLPPLVIDLINGPWSNVLFISSMKYGFGSAEWQTQIQVLMDLIWSVQPCKNLEQRQRLILLVPDLMQRLRKGLDAISYNPFEVEDLFAQLGDLHLMRIRSADKGESADKPQSISTPTPSKPKDLEHNAAVAPVKERDTPEKLTADDPHCVAVAAFPKGAWFDLTIDEKPQRCRLAAYIKPTDKYIFVDRNGVKVAEQSHNDLALALKYGHLKPLDNNMLFDKALESVVTSLRKAQNPMSINPDKD